MYLALLVILGGFATFMLGGAEMTLAWAKAHVQAREARYDTLAIQDAKVDLLAQLATIENHAVTAGTRDLAIPALSPMSATALCDVSAPCGYSASASFAVDGATDAASGTANVTAPNIERQVAIDERRIAVTMTVNLIDVNGNVLQSRPQREYIRLYAQAPYAEELAPQDAGSRANRTIIGSGENGGCAVNQSGCDPNRVQAADPTTIDAYSQCVTGVGSGTCGVTSPTQTDIENKTSQSWNNPQAVNSGGP